MSQHDPLEERATPTSQSDPAAVPPPSLEERLRHLEEHIRQMEERAARRPGAMLERLERLTPPEVRTHMRAAQRERLLALRALVDAAIKRTEQQPDERRHRSESVRID